MALEDKEIAKRGSFGRIGIIDSWGERGRDLVSTDLASNRKEILMLVCSFMMERFWGRYRVLASTPSGFREFGQCTLTLVSLNCFDKLWVMILESHSQS